MNLEKEPIHQESKLKQAVKGVMDLDIKGKIYFLAKLIAVILLGAFLIWDAMGAQPQGTQGAQTQDNKLVTDDDVDGFMKGINDLSRPVPGRLRPPQGLDKGRDLDLVLDARLPRIDGACDVAVAHEVLKISYVARAKLEGGERVLREFARKLADIEPSGASAVTPGCRTELRAFGIAVTRTFLGKTWTPNSKDEPALENRQQPAAPPAPQPSRRR